MRLMNRVLILSTFLCLSALLPFCPAAAQNAKSQRHGQVETDDNEFAEFEDPDEYTPKAHQQQQQQEKLKQQYQQQQQQQEQQQQQQEQQQQQQQQQQAAQNPDGAEDAVPGAVPGSGPAKPAAAEKEDEEARVESAEDDDFSHLTDSEEFEGFDRDKHASGIGKRASEGGASAPGGAPGGPSGSPSASASSASSSSSSSASGSGSAQPTLHITDVPQHLTTNWESFYVEMLMIGGLLVYFLNFLIGKSKNSRLVNTWFASHREMLEANFHVVGDDGKSKDEPTGAGELQRDAEHVYSLWCTGRVSCEGMLVEMKLLKRQDLVNVIAQLMKPTHDQVSVKVVMEEMEMESFVLAIAHRKKVTNLMKDYQDIATFCKEGRRSLSRFGISENFVLLSEVNEAAEALLDHRVTSTIRRFEEQIDFIHVSDQFTGPKLPNQDDSAAKLPEVKKCILFSFKVGKRGNANTSDMVNLKPLFDLVIYMIDKVKRIRLGKEAKLKAEKNRRKAGESLQKMVHSQRQEAAQQRREDKRRAEKERLLNEEDPEKARKLEERENKRELKRKQAKTKMLKIKGK